VKNGKTRNVPNHLKDANLDGKTLGHGKGYKYPHDYDGHYVEQEYWTEPVEFYKPSNEGFEGKIRERLVRIGKKKSKI